MDIARLRALRELAHRPTMAAVAEALFLTPSAVSQQITLLEQETGVKLVERQGRGVRLTPAGELLVAHADRLFAVLDEAMADMAAIRHDISGTFRVAVFPTVGSWLLPAAVQRCRQQHPHLHVVLEEMEPADGLAAVRTRRCDLAFVDDLTVVLPEEEQGIEKISLFEDALFVLLPSKHPLAEKANLPVDALKDEYWAIDSAWSGFADYVLGLCRRAGFEPRVNAQCRGFEILSAMVAEGCSIAIVAGLRLRYSTRGITAIPLKPQIKRRISAAYRSGERSHPALQAFLQALGEARAARESI
ncbi:MAG TPA: LysR substrate-binding domain-containing protein [Burkholderiaceae bacterium]|nr:LysR substrate-binding domain-containing protein [Burkholderiaceae bacterium]